MTLCGSVDACALSRICWKEKNYVQLLQKGHLTKFQRIAKAKTVKRAFGIRWIISGRKHKIIVSVFILTEGKREYAAKSSPPGDGFAHEGWAWHLEMLQKLSADVDPFLFSLKMGESFERKLQIMFEDWQFTSVNVNQETPETICDIAGHILSTNTCTWRHSLWMLVWVNWVLALWRYDWHGYQINGSVSCPTALLIPVVMSRRQEKLDGRPTHSVT